MDQRLLKAAQDGDIDQFYVLVREDPYLLERIKDNPFLNTPLHTAAAAGHTHFAVEIASLKPSFGRMLNPDGFSPLHLAVQNGNTKLVKRLLSIDNQLVRVQGKQRITPLHYAAELGNIDLLAEFLYACPKSIEDLTIRCETALHIAVKNKKFKAFNFLIDWLQLTYKKDVLNWKDDEGNTVLHIAAYSNQPQVVKLVINKINKNDKNSEEFTALDIVSQLSKQGVYNREVKDMLCQAGAKKASSLQRESASSFQRESTLGHVGEFYETWLRYVVHQHRKLSIDLRNVILVVAVLVATASYQAVLSPPGGIGQGDNIPSITNTTFPNSFDQKIEAVHRVGKSVMTEELFFLFSFLNSIAFSASMSVIVVVLHINYFSLLLHISLVFLMSSFVVSLCVISPLTNMAAKFFIVGPHAFFFGFIFSMRLWIFVRDEGVLFWRKVRDGYPSYPQMKRLVKKHFNDEPSVPYYHDRVKNQDGACQDDQVGKIFYGVETC